MPINGSKGKVLLVESHAEIVQPLARALSSAGYATIAVRTGTRALALAERAAFDLVLLDLALPDRNAREVCHELHRRSGVPVVMLAESRAAADHDAWLDGEDLVLTPKELELLARLARDAGAIVTRAQLMRDVWSTSWLGSTKTLDVHVGWLRRKLGDDPADPRFIHTVRGVGFRMASAEELLVVEQTGGRG